MSICKNEEEENWVWSQIIEITAAAEKLISLSRARTFFCVFSLYYFPFSLTTFSPLIYLIDFRMVASPRYEFPSPLDHAPQSALRYAVLKIHCHLERGREERK